MDGNNENLASCFKTLCLSGVRDYYKELSHVAEQETMRYEDYLLELLSRECEVRYNNRITRLLRASKLPLDKNLENFDMKRLPPKLQHQVKALLDGSFVDRKENILAFGNPGSGKTHLLCAVGFELVQKNRRVLYTTCALLVQELLIAKRDLELEKLLKKMARFDAIIIDDFGYVQQSREEMEVLFTLMNYRYERGCVMITSNLPFSKWETIFKDPMTTAAAIDRLIHHSIILEMNIPSYRMEKAKGIIQKDDEINVKKKREK
ncbi:IS21-like element helper ATPase IstB [Acidobacteriota bacterium]